MINPVFTKQVARVGLLSIAMASCTHESADGRVERTLVNGVVEVNNRARLGAAATLQLDDLVLRDVGGLKEREDDEFNHNNGYLSGVVLSDGGFAVIDWTRVRVFDSAGVQRAVIGREGEGPGEFAGIESICRAADDTLIVIDQRRVSVLDSRGGIVRQTMRQDFRLTGDGCFDDGSLLSHDFAASGNNDVQNRAVVRQSDDGHLLDSLGVFPRYAFRGVAQYIRLHPHGEHVYVSDPRTNEVRRYKKDGTLDQIVRMADKARRIDERSAVRWLGGPAAAMGSPNASDVRNQSEAQMWPFYRNIKIDGTGRLWVRDFPANDTAPDRWTIYDTLGVFAGSLDIPRGPPRKINNPPPGAPPFMQGSTPELIDAYGDVVILLERDADGAAHFLSRKVRPRVFE